LPWSMLGPLCILAALSLAGGWFAFPTLFGGRDHFKNFLDPVFASSAALAPAVEEASHSLELQMSALAVVIALIGLAMAWWLYFGKPLDKARSIAKSLDGLYTLVYNKYFVDEIYGALIVRPLLSISKNFLWQIVDVGMIDGTVNGAADLARLAGGQARQLQSGNARSYATWVIIGAVGFTALVVGLLGMRP
jgi:NADH-quinone oxidoreductase subunit L